LKLLLLYRAVDVFEGHLAALIGNDAVLADHASVQITRQIFWRRLALAYMDVGKGREQVAPCKRMKFRGLK
jgi:hypothetical protein